MRVLVADDSAALRDGALRALQSAGHEIVAAADGLQAWELARRQPFDAAFLQWDLPELDGLELCSLWQQEPQLRGTPLVMMVQPAHVPQARAWSDLTAGQAAGWDIMTKPFSPHLMVDVLESMRP